MDFQKETFSRLNPNLTNMKTIIFLFFAIQCSAQSLLPQHNLPSIKKYSEKASELNFFMSYGYSGNVIIKDNDKWNLFKHGNFITSKQGITSKQFCDENKIHGVRWGDTNNPHAMERPVTVHATRLTEMPFISPFLNCDNYVQ